MTNKNNKTQNKFTFLLLKDRIEFNFIDNSKTCPHNNKGNNFLKNITLRWFGMLNYLTGGSFATSICIFPLFCILFVSK